MHKFLKRFTAFFSVSAIMFASFSAFMPSVFAAGAGTPVVTSAVSPETQAATRMSIYTEWTFTLAESSMSTFSRPLWTIVSGSLPPGLEMISSPTSFRSIIVRGMPVVSGSFPVRFHIETSFDSSTAVEKSYTLTVNPMEIEARTFPNAQAGVPYSQSVNVLGGVSPYRYTVTVGQLPSGLSIDTNGRISGTPNYAVSYPFTLVAEDADGRAATRAFTITVDPDTALAIATATVPNGTVGTAYATSLQATGGTAAYSWSVSAGSLPPGVALGTSARLEGTPTTAGSYAFTIKVTDAVGRVATRAFNTTIAPSGSVVTPTVATLRILTSTLPGGTVGTWYGQTLGGAGGTAPYAWSVLGGITPPGLSVEGGSVYGTPTTAGNYAFTVKLNDATGASVSQLFNVQVSSPASTPIVTPITTPVTPIISTPVTETPSAIAERETRLRNLDRSGIAVHALVKLANDGNPLTQHDTTVYYIGADGRRHFFPNGKVYGSWYPDFSGVRVVSGTDLASIPLGASVTYKPGVKLVKFTTDPKVYAVSTNRVLRYVGTEDLAKSLYGTSWNRQIDDISDAFYSDYSFGTAVNSSADFNPATIRGAATYVSDTIAL